MISEFNIDSNSYRVDFDAGVDISIPMVFDAPQPSAFGAPAAHVRPFALADYILDTNSGGSCNVDVISIIPHCNGTHTECAGHILNDALSIRDHTPRGPIPAIVVSVEPELLGDTSDTYTPVSDPRDLVISASALRTALTHVDSTFLQALVIRTIPNTIDKLQRDYASETAPYLTLEAVDHLGELGVNHLVVDFASIDRAEDRGWMAVHRKFWVVEHAARVAGPETRIDRTITEMAFIPDSVPDGRFLIQFQIAPLQSDASPSRPILYAVRDAK